MDAASYEFVERRPVVLAAQLVDRLIEFFPEPLWR
jgi:hypothetical protein